MTGYQDHHTPRRSLWGQGFFVQRLESRFNFQSGNHYEQFCRIYIYINDTMIQLIDLVNLSLRIGNDMNFLPRIVITKLSDVVRRAAQWICLLLLCDRGTGSGKLRCSNSCGP